MTKKSVCHDGWVFAIHFKRCVSLLATPPGYQSVSQSQQVLCALLHAEIVSLNNRIDPTLHLLCPAPLFVQSIPL